MWLHSVLRCWRVAPDCHAWFTRSLHGSLSALMFTAGVRPLPAVRAQGECNHPVSCAFLVTGFVKLSWLHSQTAYTAPRGCSSVIKSKLSYISVQPSTGQPRQHCSQRLDCCSPAFRSAVKAARSQNRMINLPDEPKKDLMQRLTAMVSLQLDTRSHKDDMASYSLKGGACCSAVVRSL